MNKYYIRDNNNIKRAVLVKAHIHILRKILTQFYV